MNKKGLFKTGLILCLAIGISIIVIQIKYKGKESNPTVEAAAHQSITTNDWIVKYHVKNNRVLVENFIPGFSFHGKISKGTTDKNGYIAVFVDGKWKMNAHQSIFIIKNVPSGEKNILLQLKKKNGSDYGIKKHLDVTIR